MVLGTAGEAGAGAGIDSPDSSNGEWLADVGIADAAGLATTFSCALTIGAPVSSLLPSVEPLRTAGGC